MSIQNRNPATRVANWLRRLGEGAGPMVITQNGKAAGVMLSPAYDKLTERLQFVEAVKSGLADAEAGRLTPHDELAAQMSHRFGGTHDR